MPLAKQIDEFISEADYLDGELISEIKHEYIDGVVYAMAGASKKHNIISGNFFRELGGQLKEKKSNCSIFIADMKLKTNNRFFYPDVMVTCDDNNENDYYQTSPIIIIEVLSESTRKNDNSLKLLNYINCPTLLEYVLVEQDYCMIEVLRRTQNWQSSRYFSGDTIHFESIDVSLSLDDLYYQVDNE